LVPDGPSGRIDLSPPQAFRYAATRRPFDLFFSGSSLYFLRIPSSLSDFLEDFSAFKMACMPKALLFADKQFIFLLPLLSFWIWEMDPFPSEKPFAP